MMGARFDRRSLAICAFVLGLLAFATPGAAQTGMLKGKVVDAKNQPVQGAIVTIEMTEGMTRKYEVKTDKRGDYVQIGLQTGMYRVTASKDGMSQSFTQRITLGGAEINFTLKPGSTAEMSAEEAKKAEAKLAALRSAFDQGVALSNEGKYDEAVVKFNEVIAAAPKCVECYNNIGAVYTRKKDFDQAEIAFKKALEIKPDSADAYNGLATVYNGQKKFEEAAEASAQAQKLAAAAGGATGGGGGNASTVFNQGVIAWNAGRIPDAKKQFEEAIKLDPNLADAHYWLGMANVNENKLPESVPHFEQYLKLAPDGQYAELAKSMIAAVKK